jgi:SulP family sulfate permease
VRWSTALVAGAGIGLVEVVAAIAFASMVFGGRLDYFRGEAIGLYLGATFLTLAFFAWRAGARGVVGGLQATTVALLAIVAATTGLRARGGLIEGFLAVVAATLVVTVLCGVVCFALGIRRRGDLIRYVPISVVGGFVAGAGWVLLQGGIHLAIDEPLFYTGLDELIEGRALRLWLPTVGFGVLLLLAARFVKKPLAVPVTIGVGLVGFALVAVVLGGSLDDVRRGGWLLGSFKGETTWKTWGTYALTDADWLAVARSWGAILVAVVVGALVLMLDLGGSETVLERDLDTDAELRGTGLLTIVSGFLGAIPGTPAPGPTRVAAGMGAGARRAGVVACVVPLAALLFGASVLELLPKALVGGFLVFLGLSFVVEWVWDRRRSLPTIEYGVVLAILAVVVVRGFVPGFVVGLALSVVLFAIGYGRVDLVHEVAFGDVYRSSLDRPSADRDRLRALADRVQILRLSGHVYFGSTSRLLDRIRARAQDPEPWRFLVIDLERVTGLDASALAAFVKAERLATDRDVEVVFTCPDARIRTRLERGGVLAGDRVALEADLERGLRRCEEALLERTSAPSGGSEGSIELPPGLADHLERVPLEEGAVLLRQGEPPGGIYVLAEGRLAVETTTPEGRRIRLRTLLPGVVVGEIALYTGTARTADVVAETGSLVLRCSQERIARMEADEPVVAAAVHRWLAGTLADRLGHTMRTFDALMD